MKLLLFFELSTVASQAIAKMSLNPSRIGAQTFRESRSGSTGIRHDRENDAFRFKYAECVAYIRKLQRTNKTTKHYPYGKNFRTNNLVVLIPRILTPKKKMKLTI